MTTIHDIACTTFTFECPWGCTVRVSAGQEQPHACAGTSIMVDLLRAGVIDPGQTYGDIAERVARGLDEHVRVLRGKSWETGVRDGRSGDAFFGVDDV